MPNNTKIKKFFSFFFLGNLLICFINPSLIKCQEKYLLNDADIPDYELVQQFNSLWATDTSGQSHDVIEQKWHLIGEEDQRQNISIQYCYFATETEAIIATAYTTRTFSAPFLWGALNGFLIGDATWVSSGSCCGTIYFVRGNVGIKIMLPVRYNENDLQALEIFYSKALNKIKSNLSPEVLSFEEAARQNQIPMDDFQTITNPVVNSDMMKGFTLSSTWDSKWLTNSDSLTMGVRKEWENDLGSIASIDISQYNSDSIALKAGELRSSNLNIQSRIFYNLDSLEQILGMQHPPGFGMLDKVFSVVGVKRNFAVHAYFYDQKGIDVNFVYSLVKKLAEQLENF